MMNTLAEIRIEEEPTKDDLAEAAIDYVERYLHGKPSSRREAHDKLIEIVNRWMEAWE